MLIEVLEGILEELREGVAEGSLPGVLMVKPPSSEVVVVGSAAGVIMAVPLLGVGVGVAVGFPPIPKPPPSSMVKLSSLGNW